MTRWTFFIALLFITSNFITQAQDASYVPGQKYTLGDISVSGNTNFSAQNIAVSPVPRISCHLAELPLMSVPLMSVRLTMFQRLGQASVWSKLYRN